MGYVPPPPAPWHLTIDQQTAALERRLRHRYSRLPWRRRDAAFACRRLILLRQHDLYGWNTIDHAGPCPRGAAECGIQAPPKPPRVLPASYRV